ncbi:mechanosensitive ion channel family protein [Streptomonospora salina]|uniref:F0F1-type ATP synthase assembly protein I n=1 Tax=Streptomonospora salina TaxID=104205 RepID=A0A841EEN1_9ACTN|nr:hypothetical protein [Streptomonospora salina]MBB5999503.1 F0F1-type ATP synthase assembly protein I [Streptomonospora salina]
MNIQQGLTDAWSAVASFVPLLAGFLVILVLGWIISKIAGRLVGKGLGKVGLDRGLDRSGVGEYFQRSRYSASQLCGKIVYYVLLLVTLQFAFSVFGPNNPITQLLNDVVAWIPLAIVALVIVVVAGMIAKAARDIVSNALAGVSYGRLLGNIAGVFIMGLGVIAALNQIGVATTVTQPVLIAVLATVAGVVIVGVGGGLVRPMQERWSNWLQLAEQETGRMREDSYRAGRSDAMQQGPQGAPQQAPRESGARDTATMGGPAQGSRPGGDQPPHSPER